MEPAIAALPGVESVGAINHLPLAGDVWTLGYKIEGRPEPRPGEELSAVYRVITPGYLDAMRLRLTRGRNLTVQDRVGAPLVVLINEAMARRRWPGQDPMGKRIAYGSPDEGRPASRPLLAL